MFLFQSELSAPDPVTLPSKTYWAFARACPTIYETWQYDAFAGILAALLRIIET